MFLRVGFKSSTAFHGPLDFLLYLVKKHEVDILDIPISQITDQFLEYLPVIRAALDLDQAGEFIAMAATLAEIKSRMLLPQEPVKEEKEAPDPRRELVKQLLEYRKFKDAAASIEERAEKQAERTLEEAQKKSDQLTQDDRARLAALAEDLPYVWSHPATSVERVLSADVRTQMPGLPDRSQGN